ncbi:MAG: SUMF1/EgtB/PvdO family nonheme iron enzyme [Alphaproteobacteria bacterium]|nr:SUMF1/EgtB/PvdO family nonheme iron enzyme [Alphaproteobacteria bacterium]
MRWMAAVLFVALAISFPARAFEPGEVFQECPQCPEMVVIPPGSFVMGDDNGRKEERPAVNVTIAYPFAMAVNETTFDQWQACLDAKACTHVPDDHEWGEGKQPVINVPWEAAKGYAAWISSLTGATYRLPSEAEYEYANRGGTTTNYWWGDEIGENRVNCRFCGSKWSGDRAAPVRSFTPNPFGLYDITGNVWEWTLDCWHPDHQGAPTDGSARDKPKCGGRVTKGGAWYYVPQLARSVARVRQISNLWSYTVGFRLVREIK